MVEPKVIQEQLKAIKFGGSPWNQAELRELPKIIHEGEIISECVNGMYEGGVALLVATEMRILLIDKKPMRFLTVEDIRFDMINEIDFSHRLMNASITISTGSKTLKFKSYNQLRLRHLINLVQEHMSSGKKAHTESAETQKQHLEEINKQLQIYLMAQHQQLQQQMQQNSAAPTSVELPKPDARLADYLFTQRLMEEFQKGGGLPPQQPQAVKAKPVDVQEHVVTTPEQKADLADAARKEVFGTQPQPQPAVPAPDRTALAAQALPLENQDNPAKFFTGIEVNPVKVAYSKLPMMLRNRKFGRPSLHAHSKEETAPTGRLAPSTQVSIL